MKTLIFPYLSKNPTSGWACNLMFCNPSNQETVVELSQYDDKGILRLHSFLFVPEGRIGYYSPQVRGRFWVECSMDDKTLATSLLFNTTDNMSTNMEFEYTDKYIPDNDQMTMLYDVARMMNFTGNETCNYLRLNHLQCLRHAVFESYLDYPGEVLTMYDGSPFSGNCPNHPGSSHGKGDSIDLAYFKDFDRQSAFYYSLVNLPGDVYFMTHPDRIDELKSTEYYDYIKHKLSPDTTPIYNHDTHVHVDWRA